MCWLTCSAVLYRLLGCVLWELNLLLCSCPCIRSSGKLILLWSLLHSFCCVTVLEPVIPPMLDVTWTSMQAASIQLNFYLPVEIARIWWSTSSSSRVLGHKQDAPIDVCWEPLRRVLDWNFHNYSLGSSDLFMYSKKRFEYGYYIVVLLDFIGY